MLDAGPSVWPYLTTVKLVKSQGDWKWCRPHSISLTVWLGKMGPSSSQGWSHLSVGWQERETKCVSWVHDQCMSWCEQGLYAEQRSTSKPRCAWMFVCAYMCACMCAHLCVCLFACILGIVFLLDLECHSVVAMPVVKSYQNNVLLLILRFISVNIMSIPGIIVSHT